MAEVTRGAPIKGLPEGVWASTGQLRQMVAEAVRLRLHWQLDLRLDAVLDPDGTHIIALVTLMDRDPRTGEPFPEPVARCAAMPQFIGHDSGAAFHIPLDLRAQDYAACDPMTFSRMDADTVITWQVYVEKIREHPEIFGAS